jgi:hypothetical protein
MSEVLINSDYTNTWLCLNNHIFTLILIHIWFHPLHSYFIKTANTFVTLSFYSYFKFILFMNPLLLSNVLSDNGFTSIICYRYHNHKVIACFLSYRLFANLVSLSLITTLVATYIYIVHSISRYMIHYTFHAYKVYWITTALWHQLKQPRFFYILFRNILEIFR